MLTLEPRLIIAGGIAGSGKTTTIREIVRKVANAFSIDRDDVNNGMLHITPTASAELLPFEKYVAKDTVFPDHARTVSTPFGEKIQIDPKNAFYIRHGRDQNYLIQAEIARTNLALGKVPILDCFLYRSIKDGAVQLFMDLPAFAPYPKKFLYFMATEEDCYQRVVLRAQRDTSAAIRDKQRALSREAFHNFVTKQQPIFPQELEKYQYCLINTSIENPEACAERAIQYISS